LFEKSARVNRKGDGYMPKIKTNRSAAKRFKKTGTGKIVYHKSFGSHILSTKSRKRKRALRKSLIVHKSNLKGVKLLLPNG
jgi:large subunit ribosomal protein L35